jgi:ketosteroid isomerase-like protein
MDKQQNIEVVQRGYQAFGRGDIEGLLALLDESIEWRTPGPADFPTAGTRRGRQQVAGFFRALDEVFEIQRFEPRTFVADGERVIVMGESTSRLKATGKTFEERWVHTFTVQNGMIAGFEEYMDMTEAVADLRAAQAAT